MEVKKALKAVLFDLDETLLKLPIQYDELRRRLREHASRFNLNYDFHHILDDVEKASQILGEKFRKECYEIIEQYECQAAQKPIAEKDMKTTLEKLKKAGLKIGIISRNSRKAVALALQKTGTLKLIDIIIGREDTPKTKPHPDPIIKALEKLGIKPSEAIYVGDHPYDQAAATAANTTFIAIGNKIKSNKTPHIKHINEITKLTINTQRQNH